MMMYAIGGGIWVVGMCGYILSTQKSPKYKRRCNVKRHLIKYKKIKSDLNEQAKRF